MPKMKVARTTISVALFAFMLFAISQRVSELRLLQSLLPPSWEGMVSCDGPDVGVWGICEHSKAVRVAEQALVVTSLSGVLWCGLSFLQPARGSYPTRTLLIGMGASALAYLLWAFMAVVPSVTPATREYEAYSLLPHSDDANGGASLIVSAVWRSYWPMCGVSLCLLVRGTLAWFEVRRARQRKLAP